MERKQSNDSMVNNENTDNWTKTETPVTPVIVKPEELAIRSKQRRYVLSAEAALAVQWRYSIQGKRMSLLLVSYFVAYIAFWNGLDLVYMKDSHLSPTEITFCACKTTIGICGGYLLAAKKLAAIKAYAAVWCVIYACSTSYFFYHASTSLKQVTAYKCSRYQFSNSNEYATCAESAWLAHTQKKVSLILYTIFGFSVTYAYASMAAKFEKDEKERVLGQTVLGVV